MPSSLPPYAVVARNIDPHADNLIHDDGVAQRYGFSGALVPGVELFAYCTAPLVAAWGDQWLSGGSLAVRFRRPVHDGEQVTVTTGAGEGDGLALSLLGPDGTVRTRGTASPPSDQAPPDLARYPATPLPEALREAPQLGPLGTVEEPAEPAACEAYLDAVDEVHPVYLEHGLVHPGLLLRLVNAALMRNVALGPWIHTASDCRFLSPARVGERVAVRSTVHELFERGGHSYVRYDALVLAGQRPVAEVQHEAIWRLA